MALARRFHLEVILAKGPYPKELAANSSVRICPYANLKYVGRYFYFFWVLLLVGRARYRSGRKGDDDCLLFVTTHQPLCILAGALAQLLLHVRWVADVFDVPALGLEITQGIQNSWIRWLSSIPRRLLTEISYRALKRADLVLCTLVPDALARCSISDRKVLLLTNGIELRDYSSTVASNGNHAEVFELLYIGAILRIRGVDTMLDACRLLVDSLPGLRLTLVGRSEPEELRWLERRVAELGLKAAVSITGELPHEEVLRRVHEADICLFPFPRNYATEYIYPVKVLEYIGAGKAVIASDLIGVRRIIEDDHSGILVEPGNPQALASAICELWKNSELRVTLGANARAAAPKFEWNRINGQMLEALHTLTEEN